MKPPPLISPMVAPGPFRAEQIRPKDPYELSDGHAIRVLPTGVRGSVMQAHIGAAIANDPLVEEAGVDTGFSPEAGTLRAPDIAVVRGGLISGWAPGVPPFAIEYADRGQDEAALASKIADLLRHGTQQIWVVRLSGLPRVEIHSPGGMRLADLSESLRVPGVLQNPVPVRALFDPGEARKLELQNLLARLGYQNVEAIREEGREEGRVEAREKDREKARERGREEGALHGRRANLRVLLAARGLPLSPADERRLDAATDPAILDAWVIRAATASSSEGLFD